MYIKSGHYVNYSPIGIDIGTRSVNIVQLATSSNGLYIHDSDIMMLPDDNIGEGTIIPDVLTKILKQDDFRGKEVVTRMPPSLVSIIPVKISLRENETIEKAILRESKKYNPSKLMYIIAGCYGQPGSSVYRLALNEHERVHINENDMFIFSADPGPAYSKESIDFIVDKLTDLGVDVHYYDLHEGLHVSGHGTQGDIVELFKIVNPKYFVPTGGTIRYMKAYEKLSVKFGAKEENILRLKPGESVIFDGEEAKKGETIPVKVHFDKAKIERIINMSREKYGTDYNANKLKQEQQVITTDKVEKDSKEENEPKKDLSYRYKAQSKGGLPK